MTGKFSLTPISAQLAEAQRELAALNVMGAQYGLTLSQKQLQRLVEHRFETLKNTGRVEFGEGVLKKLVLAFCDSPYISQQTYEETLTELQELFYLFKNETKGALSDDELIEAMRFIFNERARGALDYLAGADADTLYLASRGLLPEADTDDWGDEL